MQWRRGSDTRIVLVKPRERVVVPRKPCVPTLAGGLRGGQAADRGHDVALPLEDLHGETGGRVPGCGQKLVIDWELDVANAIVLQKSV